MFSKAEADKFHFIAYLFLLLQAQETELGCSSEEELPAKTGGNSCLSEHVPVIIVIQGWNRKSFWMDGLLSELVTGSHKNPSSYCSCGQWQHAGDVSARIQMELHTGRSGILRPNL